jgi:hypothetical protein
MTTLIAIVDLVVLLMYLVHIPRFVSNSQARGTGQLVLSVCIAVAIAIFGVVSVVANAGLVAATSSATQAVILLALVVMAALVRVSWSDKSAA